MSRRYIITSESVGEGHPDKVADSISDSVLDAVLAEDPNGRVACETLVKTRVAILAGEITTTARVDYVDVARNSICAAGYDDPELGFDGNSCSVFLALDRQSPDIAQGVNEGDGLDVDQGAGDQGLMYGYACRENEQLMPLPIHLAHSLTRSHARLRRSGELPWLRPDSKSQVSVVYENGRPVGIDTIVMSAQHAPDISHDDIKDAIVEQIIRPVLPESLADGNIRYLINPTGRFVVGGPVGDCGLTGRKIVVDTYGGVGRHGGGAFSGKDPSKVDRSGAYMARHVAKNVVSAKLADRCEVQIAYAIGVAKPVSVHVNTFGTARYDDGRIEDAINQVFDLRPKAIIRELDLLRPIYAKTATGGHFGRSEPEFTWESVGKRDELLAAIT
ncbi:MAG: methionine adenosyltransferase [Rhodobacteraceae bacterium]|nr:methionine adenosyltransferase [Paracoccaceae bacterium]MCY4138578.1 methionine adenosyltransferase [Paracoccaceae bacterium]